MSAQSEMVAIMQAIRPDSSYRVVDGLLYWDDDLTLYPTDAEVAAARADLPLSPDPDEIRRGGVERLLGLGIPEAEARMIVGYDGPIGDPIPTPPA